MMMDEERRPGPIDPRFLHRLGDTMTSRLKDIETSRAQARWLLTEVRQRIDYLERTFGLPLDECRDECDRVLEKIEAIGGPTLPTREDIEVLAQQVIRLSAMVSTIDSAGFSRQAPRGRSKPEGGDAP